MALALDDTVVAGRDQASAALAGESVILGMRDAMYYGVDGTAARIWQLVQQPITVERIVHTLCAEFDVAPARCQSDVLQFVDELIAKNLVERIASGSAR